MYVGGKNSYGGMVPSYISYEVESGAETYTYSLNSLEEEEYYSWDDSADKLEKALNNLYRITCRLTISSHEEEDNMVNIDRIMSLYKNNSLKDVENVTIVNSTDNVY
jgi:hypothetical protein